MQAPPADAGTQGIGGGSAGGSGLGVTKPTLDNVGGVAQSPLPETMSSGAPPCSCCWLVICAG